MADTTETDSSQPPEVEALASQPDSGGASGGTLASLAQPAQPPSGSLSSAMAAPDTASIPEESRSNAPQPPAQAPLQGLGGRLRGVLYGLATGGIPGMVEGAIAPNVARTHFQQREQVRAAKTSEAQSAAAQAQQNVQFESVRAADSHILALKQAQHYDAASDEARAQVRQLNDAHEKFLTDEYGILPDLVLEGNGQEVHDQATGGLNTLAGENGGQIPPVSVNVQPHTADQSKFRVGVYAPSLQDLQQNQRGFRQMVDDARAVQGLPPIDDLSWNTQGFKGQREMAQGALGFLAPTQSFTKDNIGALLAQRQQMLANYAKHVDQNGQPDAKPALVSQLQQSVDFLKKAKQDILDENIASKVAEEKATLPYELAKSRAMAEARMSLEGMAKPVYAFNPQTNERELMSQTEAIAQGRKVMTPVTEKEVSDDIQLTNRLSDVHQKISQYEQAMAQPVSEKDRGNMAALISGDKLKIGAFGTELPMDRANAIFERENIKNLSDAAKNRIVAFYNAREALTGYNRVLTGSGRANEQTLELQLQTLPNPATADDSFSTKALVAFKQNLNVVDQGIPRIPGVKHPSEWESEQSGGAAAGTVKLKAPNGQVKIVPSDQADHYKKLGAVVVP